MNQSATRKVSIKWDITVPSQFNDDIVSFLASQGKKQKISLRWFKKRCLVIFCPISREKPNIKSEIRVFLKKIWTRSLRTALFGQKFNLNEGRS